MQSGTILNSEAVSYLIHGQPFTLEIEATGCLFVVIRYDGGQSPLHRWAIRRRRTVFRGLTKAQYPTIRVWGVGFGIEKILEKRLRVHVIDVKEPDLDIRVPQPVLPTGMSIQTQMLDVGRLTLNVRGSLPALHLPNAVRTTVKPIKIRNVEVLATD